MTARALDSNLPVWRSGAPWILVGIGPLLALAAAYFLACSILWSGWSLFLPGAETPFVRLHGIAIAYFGVGRMLYFAAPVLVGWGIGLIAGRRRLGMLWPGIGLLLVAAAGAAAQVEVSPPAIPALAGHVRMGLVLSLSPSILANQMMHAAAIFAVAAAPCLFWRLRGA